MTEGSEMSDRQGADGATGAARATLPPQPGTDPEPMAPPADGGSFAGLTQGKAPPPAPATAAGQPDLAAGPVPCDESAWALAEQPESPLDAAVRARDATCLRDVRDAVAAGRVLLAFQPVVQAARPDRIAFHEGLIRLLDPAGRVIPAAAFIGQVERHELGRQIDCLALERGLETLRVHPDLRLSINMSARSIGYPRWMEVLHRGLARDDTVGERLILEITEASAMLMPDIVSTFMRDLRRRGIAFALDDFGAGYTSFRYLREFLFDIVKIDGQFVRDIHLSADNQVLAAALVSIAQHFDMFTVAEAVQSADEAVYLAETGLDCLQGYFFGAPTIRPDWAEQAQRQRA